MLTGPLQNNKRPSFSGHETFPMRYGWLTKMMDYFDPNQQKNDLIIKTQSFSKKLIGEKVSELMADWVGETWLIRLNLV